MYIILESMYAYDHVVNIVTTIVLLYHIYIHI